MLACLAALAWFASGWPFARRCLPEGLAPVFFAPLLGWAVQTALAAAVLPWLGVTRPAILGTILLPLAASWAWHRRASSPVAEAGPWWPLAPAALLALLPMAGILPKHAQGGILLSAPIFDHAKIAIVDAIARAGLPPPDPFFSGDQAPGPLAYYYWWHLSAAELARLAGVTGWTADAALTWFTAGASLLLIAGLAEALAPRAAMPAMLLTLPASLRPLTGGLERAGILLPASGLGGWLNQASWAPQHLAAACLLILAVLLLVRLAEAPSLAGAAALAAALAVGFGSSAWVGGIVCAAAAPLAVLAILARLPSGRRMPFLTRAAVAALAALAIAAPLIQIEAAASLHRGPILRLAPYPVFAAAGPVADLCGVPLLLLIEFPVAATLGLWGARRAWHRSAPSWQPALAITALAALAISATLRSTIDNNDLGWRAALVPLLIGLAFAAPAFAAPIWRQLSRTGRLLACLPMLGLLGTWPLLRENLRAHPEPAAAFAAAPALWRAVRAIVPPEARIASDPRLDAGMTLWPANIGWALLADRSSCYAGWATAHSFVPIAKAQLYAIHRQFLRVFDGTPDPADLADLARLHCAYGLLTPDSPAWRRDPFAASPHYRRAAAGPGWRLYQVLP